MLNPAVADEPSVIPIHDPLQPIAAEPAIPPPAIEKKYRLPAGQKVPPAHLHQRTAKRKYPEVRGLEEQGAEPAAVPPPVHPVQPKVLLNHLFLQKAMKARLFLRES